MARNSGKTHRIVPANKSNNRPSQAEKSRLRTEKHSGNSEPQPQRNYTFKEVQPLNFVQGEYLEAIKYSDVIFGIGSAGTGKTFNLLGALFSQSCNMINKDLK